MTSIGLLPANRSPTPKPKHGSWRSCTRRVSFEVSELGGLPGPPKARKILIVLGLILLQPMLNTVCGA